MPNLLQINSALGRGSTGRISEQIASLAKQKGWSCVIAHGSRFTRDSEISSFQISTKIEELFHYMVSRVLDSHGLVSLRATKRLIRHIEKIKPDVVHIHNIHGYYANYKLLFEFLVEKGIPTVFTMHDFWLMTGHCAYINKSCSKWETGCGKCPRLKEYPASFFDCSHRNWVLKKKLFDSFDKDKLVIVPVSYWLEGFTKKSLLRNSKIHTIQNGINTNIFHPYEGKHSELYNSIDWNKYTIITVADRWTEANGFKEIITLSGIIPDNMQILMVGLSNKQMQCVPGNIVGISHLDNVNQLIELYTKADVLFNASREVTFGLVTAEAMACGTPAIVIKNTAGEEIINEATGFVIDNLYEIPKIVYKCREKSNEYKVSCRKRIVENYDSISQFAKYIELYNSILRQ